MDNKKGKVLSGKVGHTPGPWKVLNWVVFGSDDKAVAEVVGEYKGKGNPLVDANASLIAASPELLEGCRTALLQLQRFSESETNRATTNIVKRAIAKATGQ